MANLEIYGHMLSNCILGYFLALAKKVTKEAAHAATSLSVYCKRTQCFGGLAPCPLIIKGMAKNAQTSPQAKIVSFYNILIRKRLKWEARTSSGGSALNPAGGGAAHSGDS